MKIAFVQNFWYEYLGVMSISAVVRKHHHLSKVFINGWEKELIKSVAEFNPEVIAFPVYSGSQGWVIKTAGEMKRKLKKLVVLGGPHATFFPDIIKEKGIDVVCRGEGEYPMLDLLNALAGKRNINQIANLWIKNGRKIIKNPIRPLINPLNNLPLLDRSLYYRYSILQKNAVKNFSIGRGCPFRCAYCHNSGLLEIYHGKGAYVRNYASQRVIKEIRQVTERYPLKTLCFVDDTFIWDKRWLLRFLPIYKKEIDLPFVCNIRGGLLNEELVKALAGAGCVSVFMGVETGNEKMRLQLLQKLVSDTQLKETAQLLHKYKIKLAANNMVGLPGESLAEAIQTIKLNAQMRVDLPWCSVFQPYPGTKMAEYCLKHGFAKRTDLTKIGVNFHRQSVIKVADIDQLVNLHKLFHFGVWFPWVIPVLRVLIKLPLVRFYELIFLVNQGLTYMRFFHLRPVDFLPHAWYFARFYLYNWKRHEK